MVGVLTLAAYFLGFTRLAAPGSEGPVANTMAFATLTLCQLFHAFNVRSEDRSLFAMGPLSNSAMNRAFLAGWRSQLAGFTGAASPERLFHRLPGPVPVAHGAPPLRSSHSHL